MLVDLRLRVSERAYSGVTRSPIPQQGDQRFQSKAIAKFRAFRSLIPVKSIGDSGRGETSWMAVPEELRDAELEQLLYPPPASSERD